MRKPTVTSMAPMMEVTLFPSLAQAIEARGPDGTGTTFGGMQRQKLRNGGKCKLQIQVASIIFTVG